LIASPKEVEKQKLVEMLINIEDAKGYIYIFKIAKQIINKNKDVVGARSMKDVEESIVLEDKG